MNRREFFICLFSGTAARPVATRAQQTGIKISRVGVLSSSFDSPHTGQGFPLLLAELRKLGFSEGQNLAVQHGRIDEGAAKAFIAANELVAAKANLLMVSGAETGLQAAAAARPAVPIVVMANNFDPIARGYVASLSHPGGNITGLFYRHPELARKQLELLLEALPGKQRVGILWDHDSTEQFQVAEAAAQILQFKLLPFKLENPPYNWEAAFRTLALGNPEMLLVLSSALFAPYHRRIAELANQYRLPSMYIFKYYVEAGGLMSYGVDTNPLWHRVASYVAQILRGAEPGDLPLERVTNFELAVNMKTAKALGLTIPPSLLACADEVIE